MPDTKISALTEATSLAGDETFPVVQGGSTKKAPIDLIRPKNNMEATARPSVTDDSSAGYRIGSIWMWNAKGRLWRCRDASAGAAVWQEFDNADHPGYPAGYWFTSSQAVASGSANPNVAWIRYSPLVLKSRVTISDIGARVSTAGGNIALAIYRNDPTTNRPTGTPLASTGSLNAGSTGWLTAALTANVTFEPGLYWVAVETDNLTVVLQAFATSQFSTPVLAGTATLNNIGSTGSLNIFALYTTGATFGVWPDLTGVTVLESNSSGAGGPVLAFKAA